MSTRTHTLHQPGSTVPTSPLRVGGPLRGDRTHNFRYEWTDEQLVSKEFRCEFFGRGGPDTEVWQQVRGVCMLRYRV